MKSQIEALIEKYSNLADAFNESIKIVQTSQNYEKERTEWTWYLKGQQKTLQAVSLELKTMLLMEEIKGKDSDV